MQDQVPGNSVALASTLVPVPDETVLNQQPRRMRQPSAAQLGPGQYCWGTGRRKSSTARVRVRPGSGKIMVNKRELATYFSKIKDQTDVRDPLKVTDSLERYDVFVNVNGGGSTGQAGAIKLGLARALIAADGQSFELLRDAGYLTRDSRMSERKKYGLKKARKSFQFSKR